MSRSYNRNKKARKAENEKYKGVREELSRQADRRAKILGAIPWCIVGLIVALGIAMVIIKRLCGNYETFSTAYQIGGAAMLILGIALKIWTGFTRDPDVHLVACCLIFAGLSVVSGGACYLK